MDSLPVLKVPYYPLSPSLPRIRRGIAPLDNGHLSQIDDAEAERIRGEDSVAAGFLRPLASSQNLLDGKGRWCLWLEGVDTSIINSSPELTKRTRALKKFRSESRSRNTQQWQELPEMLIQGQVAHEEYLAIPLEVKDEYEYLPVAHLSPEVVANQSLGVIEEEEFFVAGILSSRIFHLWRKTAKERFDPTTSLTTFALYQTIPVPVMDAGEREEIEHNFDRLLRVRSNFMPNTLAELYSPSFKPNQLRQAHMRLNLAVYSAYHFPNGISEGVICERLFALHQSLITLD